MKDEWPETIRDHLPDSLNVHGSYINRGLDCVKRVSLVPERLNRIQISSFNSGEEAGDDADEGAEGDGDHHGGWSDHGGVGGRRDQFEDADKTVRGNDAEGGAKQGDDHAFDE